MNEDEIIETEEEIPEPEEEKINYGSVPASILAGIVGAFIALIIAAASSAIFGGERLFPYILFPLLICVFTKLFSGHTGAAGFIVTVLFSFAGMYLVPAFVYATEYCSQHEISVLSVPLVAATSVAENNFLTGFAVQSADILPIVLVLAGLSITWQAYRYFTKVNNEE